MKKNMGKADQVIRIILGLIFGTLFFAKVVTGVWGLVLLILGAVFLLTSFVGVCPLYMPFGIRTCKKD